MSLSDRIILRIINHVDLAFPVISFSCLTLAPVSALFSRAKQARVQKLEKAEAEDPVGAGRAVGPASALHKQGESADQQPPARVAISTGALQCASKCKKCILLSHLPIPVQNVSISQREF